MNAAIEPLSSCIKRSCRWAWPECVSNPPELRVIDARRHARCDHLRDDLELLRERRLRIVRHVAHIGNGLANGVGVERGR